MQNCAPLYHVAKDEVDRLSRVIAALRKPSLADRLNALAHGKRGGNLVLPLGQKSSKQTGALIQLVDPLSSQRARNAHVLRAGSSRRVQAPGALPKRVLFAARVASDVAPSVPKQTK